MVQVTQVELRKATPLQQVRRGEMIRQEQQRIEVEERQRKELLAQTEVQQLQIKKQQTEKGELELIHKQIQRELEGKKGTLLYGQPELEAQKQEIIKSNPALREALVGGVRVRGDYAQELFDKQISKAGYNVEEYKAHIEKTKSQDLGNLKDKVLISEGVDKFGNVTKQYEPISPITTIIPPTSLPPSKLPVAEKQTTISTLTKTPLLLGYVGTKISPFVLKKSKEFGKSIKKVKGKEILPLVSGEPLKDPSLGSGVTMSMYAFPPVSSGEYEKDPSLSSGITMSLVDPYQSSDEWRILPANFPEKKEEEPPPIDDVKPIVPTGYSSGSGQQFRTREILIKPKLIIKKKIIPKVEDPKPEVYLKDSKFIEPFYKSKIKELKGRKEAPFLKTFKRKKERLFFPEVRRYGIWKPIIKKPVGRKIALRIGIKRLKKTLSASLRLRETETGKLIKIAKETRLFRLGKKGKDPFTIVQRKKARLGTFGEKREIAYSRRGGKRKSK